jgi:uncharacterized protein YecE (DUF72 family)
MSPARQGYQQVVTVRIGTSGWQYGHWRPGFYHGVPARRWLAHYVEHFSTVELNGSFYRLPDRERFERWADALPPGFTMAVKASRYLTHVRRLHDPAEPVARLAEAARGLGDRLGPILVQLPPNLPLDLDGLDATLSAFPDTMRVAVEPRHPTWWTHAVRGTLERHGAALVEADRRGPVGPGWQTTTWRYVRFHAGRAHPEPCYGERALDSWAARLEGAGDVYVYFNNDQRGCAIRDARLLAAAVRRHGLDVTRVPPPALTRITSE